MTRKEFIEVIIWGYGYRADGVEVETGVPDEVAECRFLRTENRYESRDEWIGRIHLWSKTDEGEACRKNLMERWEAERIVVEKERKTKLLSGAGIPPYLIQKLAEPIFDTGPLCAVREHGKKLLLVLAGGVGSGKTIAAIWLMAQAITDRNSALYCSATELARWDRYSRDEMAKLFSPRVLVIDDVGSEFRDEKGAFVSILEDVINTRCLNNNRTVLTTNISAEEFKKRYQDRIASRVNEFGAFHEFKDTDLRRAMVG